MMRTAAMTTDQDEFEFPNKLSKEKNRRRVQGRKKAQKYKGRVVAAVERSRMSTDIADFLVTVALGNSDPDNLAKEAADLLETFGVKMTEIAKGQYVENK
jgi:NCAIR mutase (PurE)-related protein